MVFLFYSQREKPGEADLRKSLLEIGYDTGSVWLPALLYSALGLGVQPSPAISKGFHITILTIKAHRPQNRGMKTGNVRRWLTAASEPSLLLNRPTSGLSWVVPVPRPGPVPPQHRSGHCSSPSLSPCLRPYPLTIPPLHVGLRAPCKR